MIPGRQVVGLGRYRGGYDRVVLGVERHEFGADELLRPCPDEWLEAFPVGTRVNDVRNDAAELIAPVNPA